MSSCMHLGWAKCNENRRWHVFGYSFILGQTHVILHLYRPIVWLWLYVRLSESWNRWVGRTAGRFPHRSKLQDIGDISWTSYLNSKQRFGINKQPIASHLLNSKNVKQQIVSNSTSNSNRSYKKQLFWRYWRRCSWFLSWYSHVDLHQGNHDWITVDYHRHEWWWILLLIYLTI